MLLKSLYGAIVALSIGASALAAAPQEKTIETITRNAQSPLTLRTELVKNVYRQEPYQDSYTEQVPYEAEETYYIDVPYQAEETYTERIPYQEEETYYEDIPYRETVPYTDYEEYYDSEYQCENVTRYREECRSENLCEPGRRECRDVEECGTNAHGERICKTRKVCEDGPRQCRDVRRCDKVPYTEQKCGYERVRKTRPVTKYREETRYRQERRTRTVTKYREEQRTRTVTRYRQEPRTRTVTKYREEVRCCITRYRDVYDHQFTQPVSVIFPVGTELKDQEIETLILTLSGTEDNPQVEIKPGKTVFAYEIEKVQQEGREKVIFLKMIPKWNKENAGPSTIDKLKLTFTKDGGKVTFQEGLLDSRIQTTYHVEIRDAQSQSLLFEQTIAGTGQTAVIVPTQGILREGKYTVLLKVLRKGITIDSGALEFEQSITYEKTGLSDEEIAALGNRSLVQISGVTGSGAERIVNFKDASVDDEEVQTTYKLVVWKRNPLSGQEWVGEKAFTRQAVVRGNALGIAFKDLKINPSGILSVDLVVTRQSAKYLGSKKVQFIINKSL